MSVQPILRKLAAATAAAALVTLASGGTASARRPAAEPPPDLTSPTAPTNLTATSVTQTSVTLTWGASTDNIGVAGYAAWATDHTSVIARTTQTSVTVQGLRPGTSYRFVVQAHDARFNWSWPSDPVTVTTQRELNPPTTPSGLTVEAVDNSKVLLQWTSSTDDWGPVRYEVLVDGVPTPNAWSTVIPGTFPPPPTQGAWVRQLEPATSYAFAVRAIDGNGNVSASSNTDTATTEPSSDTVAPTTPTLLSVSVGGTGVCPEELWTRWTGSTDDVDGAFVEYEFRINGVINEVIPGGTQTVAYTDVLGTNTVTIVAVDRAGNASAPSNAITETTNWGPGGCGAPL
jgi:chitodextrinase